MIDVQRINTGMRAAIAACGNVEMWHMIESASYLPPEDVKDVDYLILANNTKTVGGVDAWAKRFQSFRTDLAWEACSKYGDIPAEGGGWFAYRGTNATGDNVNVIVTNESSFFWDFVKATEVCAALQLKDKRERIVVCKVIRDHRSWQTARSEAGL